MHDKNWSGGAPHEISSGGPPGRGPPPGQQQRAQQAAAQAAQESMQRFAQEFPSLDSGGGDNSKGGSASAQGKNQDNQYGPGPILRPQSKLVQLMHNNFTAYLNDEMFHIVFNFDDI